MTAAPSRSSDDRRLGLRRRRRHPGRPEGLRRARRVRHQRAHGGHRAEHPGVSTRCCTRAAAHGHRAARRGARRPAVARGEDRDARHPGDRGRGGRARPGPAGCRTWSSTRCWSPRAVHRLGVVGRGRAAAAVRRRWSTPNCAEAAALTRRPVTTRPTMVGPPRRWRPAARVRGGDRRRPGRAARRSTCWHGGGVDLPCCARRG